MTEKVVHGRRGLVRSNPVAVFMVLTFVISWSIWGAARALPPGTGSGIRLGIHNLGLCGPTLAALLLSGILYGREGAACLLKRIARWRVGIGWYLFAVLSILALGLAARAIHSLTVGGTAPLNLEIMWVQMLVLPAGLPEEYGWRGFALPHLLERHGAITSSLVIAVFWVLWHIPISPMLSKPPLFALFLLEVIPLSILFSWLYVNSHGSILLAVLFHLVANAAVYILNIPASPSLWVTYIGVSWVFAAMIAARYGVSRLSRHGDAEIRRDLWVAARPAA